MAPSTESDTTVDTNAEPTTAGDVEVLVDDEVLVEEISIDGMCGVY